MYSGMLLLSELGGKANTRNDDDSVSSGLFVEPHHAHRLLDPGIQPLCTRCRYMTCNVSVSRPTVVTYLAIMINTCQLYPDL